MIVVPIPMYDPLIYDTSSFITAVVDTPCSPCQVKVPVNLNSKASSVCSTTGDPHFATFNGISTSYQGAGSYYLVKTPFLVVEVNQYICGAPATCNSGVAIR